MEVQDQPPQEPLECATQEGGVHVFYECAAAAAGDYKDWAEKRPFAATTVETLALFTVRHFGGRLARRAGIDTGNAFEGQHIEVATAHPVRGVLQAIVVAPLMEEVLFRGALEYPARKAEEGSRYRAARTIRMIAALGFAVGHSGLVRPAEEWPHAPYVRVGAQGATVPIQQFVGGLNYSRLKNERGLRHAIAAHMLNNMLYAASAVPEVMRRRSR